MSESEIRCPYCNGTARLPAERVRQIEADRDEFSFRKEVAGLLWSELCDLVGESNKKKATLESLRVALRSSHGAMRRLMTLDRIMGR